MIIKKSKKKNNNNSNSELTKENENSTLQSQKEPVIDDDINLFEPLTEIKERQERRRGDRRRGYRRIEDRNLVSRAQEEAKIIKNQATDDGYKQGLEKANQEIPYFNVKNKDLNLNVLLSIE